MKIEVSKKALIQYFLIYLCLLNTSSYFSRIIGDGFIVFTMLISVILMLLNIVPIKKNYFCTIGGLFAFITIQHCLIQEDIGFNSLMNLLSKFLIAYCAVKYDVSNFKDRFVKLTAMLSLISSICFLISLSPLEPLLRIILIQNSSTSYGGLLYHYIVDYGRNVGIFREPGVYVIFLNLALFFILFFGNLDKDKLKYLFFIILGLATAGSTAGYITALIVLLGFVTSKRNQLNVKTVVILLGAIVGVMIFIQTDYFYENFTSKMMFQDGKFAEGTGNARLASMMIDISLIKNNFWGTGMTGVWTNTSSIAVHEVGSSVGLTATILAYGIPLSIFIYAIFIWAFKRISSTKIIFCTLIAMFISSFLSQPWVLSPSYLMIVALGFCLDNNSIQTDFKYRSIG